MISNALILLGAAILVATVFHAVRLPPIVAFITAGILIGPSGLALISSPPQVGYLTEIAAVLLMFTIGLEFSLKELQQFRRPILILGLAQVLFTILLFTFLFWLAFKMPIEKAIFLSLLVAPSSTAVVLKILHDHRDFESPYGKATFSVLLLQDIAVIPMIVAVPFLVSYQSLAASFLDSLFPLLLLALLVIIFLYLISKYALPFVLHRVSQTRNREIFFFTVLFVCLGSATLMHIAGLSVSLGAFVAGMILAGSHYGKQATAEILPLRDSFLSLFFVAIGMILDVKFLFTHLHQILLLGTAVILLKCLIIFSIVWLTGNTSSVSRAVTALLFQFGEFSFILAELGVRHELLLEKERQFFVAIAIITLATTPLLYSRLSQIMHDPRWDKILPQLLISRAEKFRQKVQRLMSRPLDMDEIETKEKISNHILIIGFGVAGQSLCRVLQHLNIQFQIIELNAETVRIHSPTIPIMFGDASNLQLLRSAGLEEARLVAILTSGVNMAEPVLNAVRRVRPDVPVLIRANYLRDIQRLKSQGPTKFIISEMESTLEVIGEALREFQVAGSTIDELISSLRKELRQGIGTT